MNNDIIISSDEIGLFCRLYMNIKKDIPIRPSEMGVLIFAQKQSSPVTPLMISNFFKITKPSVTALVNVLINKNYLVKTPSSEDGRSYTVSITKKGKELVEAAQSEYFRTMELLKENMGVKDFRLFIELIHKANTILSEDKQL